MKMLKKLISILLTMAIIFAVGGCSPEEEVKTDNPVNNTQGTKEPDKDVEKDNEGKNDKESAYDKANFLTKTYKHPYVDFYVDVPEYHQMTEAASEMWNVDSEHFIIVAGFDALSAKTSKFKLEDLKKIEDILPAVKNPIIRSSERKSYCDIKDLVIDNTEKKEIAGREVLRFTGHFTWKNPDATTKDRYVVGYVTFFNKMPVYVVGVNSNKDQKQEYSDEATKVVDAMIKTLRDKE